MHILLEKIITEEQFEQEDIVTTEQYEKEYKQKWSAELATSFLQSKGIFPLKYSNKKLPLLTLLGMYTYLSGSLSASPHSKPPVMRARISQAQSFPNEIVEACSEHLGLILKSDGKDYEFSQNGAYYARLLWKMGFHASEDPIGNTKKKATLGSDLPTYLTRLTTDYDKLNITSKSKAKYLLKIMTSALFNTKGYTSDKIPLTVQLIPQPSEEQLITQAKFWVDAINIIYPEIQMNMEDNFKMLGSYITQDINVHEARFSFNFQQLIKFPRDGAPVSFRTVLQPALPYTRIVR
jgi:hypothetical protein